MERRRVAVVGSGVAGLCAAWHLQRSGKFDITLLESADRMGGNALTVDVNGVPVDVGFLVYNNATYPNLISLFEELEVETVESDMSFGFSLNQSLEWASHSVDTLFAQRSNLLSPSFHQMLKDMLRFNSEMSSFLCKFDEHEDVGPSLGEFLESRNYSRAFIDHYLIPMIAAVWSATTRSALSTPARTIFRFFENHRLAQIFDRPQWRTVKGGSHMYVRKICADIERHGGKLRTKSAVRSAKRTADGIDLSFTEDDGQRPHRFDEVVFATHVPTTMSILGEDITAEERAVLSKFEFSEADCILHQDSSWMPARKNAWSAWNFVQRRGPGDRERDLDAPVCVTYHLNRLQKNSFTEYGDVPDLFETLNPNVPIPEELVVKSMKMSHPQFSAESYRAQRLLPHLQGQNRTYFCGSWTRFGFHEDGARSGFAVAEQLSGTAVPWASRLPMLEKIETRASYNPERSWMSLITEAVSRPIVESFLRSSVRLGSLTVIDSNGVATVIGESLKEARAAGRPATEMCILNDQFYPRVASVADIGFAEAYMLGWVDFESVEKLLDLFRILILNRDDGSLSNANLRSSKTGTSVNNWMHKLLRRNTLSGSKKNIAAHYDLSNDLFATFLGKTWTYSCGLWLEKKFTLDDAQVAKLDRMISLARLESSCHLLEVGFGWGELAIRAAKTTGCRVTGVTLSVEQLELAQERVKEAGVEDLVTLQLCDYREIQGQFDRIISIEMMEAVGHEFLGDFFAACERCLKPEGLLVVQVITTPEDRYETYRTSSDFISRYIFPGGCCPSVAAILEAMSRTTSFSLINLDSYALHYAKTLASWRDRFLLNRKRVAELGFDEVFFRMWTYYFTYCEAGFASRTLGLKQMVFSRGGNLQTLGSEP